MTVGGDELLTAAVSDAALGLPAAHVRRLATAVAAHPTLTPAVRAAAVAAVPTPTFRDQARRVLDAWEHTPGVNGAGVAVSLRAAAEAIATVRSAQFIDIAWTGPATAEVPVRLTREVLLEVIGAASRTLVIVSFAAYKVPDIVEAIAVRARAGVDVRMVLETGEDEGGPLRFGAARAFAALAGLVRFYDWPLERRDVLPGGGHGSMHAKAAVADEHTALVTSANFTGQAITANMELGLLIRGGPVPKRLANHFRALMIDDVLQPIEGG